MSSFRDEDKNDNRNILNLPSSFTKMDAIRAFAKLKNELEMRIKQENLSENELRETEEKLAAGRMQCLAILSMHDITCCGETCCDGDGCDKENCDQDQNICGETCCDENYSSEECYTTECDCNECSENADVWNNHKENLCTNNCSCCQGSNFSATEECLVNNYCGCQNENAQNVGIKNMKSDDVVDVLENNMRCVSNYNKEDKIHGNEDLMCVKIQDAEIQAEESLKAQHDQCELVVQDVDDEKKKGLCGLGWFCF
ncbi:uncharacterized protein VICG_01029 [Vittaforma corneae ATCC 50505]|uniref:Uncharacterized protein n=1 Tax=Vittaforma corneae (strain ATCC 50505) TaxID=993615 RepID=L2GNW5_VITCO|nr:uncharacterized protein VICG_01029 [Vittaforma corneae ATCC 50505]ELA42012.1 hypothetical protein VICG_01029 [Vittaforma corneae ATCC 50505]